MATIHKIERITVTTTSAELRKLDKKQKECKWGQDTTVEVWYGDDGTEVAFAFDQEKMPLP